MNGTKAFDPMLHEWDACIDGQKDTRWLLHNKDNESGNI